MFAFRDPHLGPFDNGLEGAWIFRHHAALFFCKWLQALTDLDGRHHGVFEVI
jgi:hypothetical protein